MAGGGGIRILHHILTKCELRQFLCECNTSRIRNIMLIVNKFDNNYYVDDDTYNDFIILLKNHINNNKNINEQQNINKNKIVSKKYTKSEWIHYYNNQPPILQIPNDCLNVILSFVIGNENKYNNMIFFPLVCKKWNKLKRIVFKTLNIEKPSKRYINYKNGVKSLRIHKNFNFNNQKQLNNKSQNYKSKKNRNNIHQPKDKKY